MSHYDIILDFEVIWPGISEKRQRKQSEAIGLSGNKRPIFIRAAAIRESWVLGLNE